MENLVIDTVGDCKIWQGQRQVSKGSVSVFCMWRFADTSR